MSSRIFLDSSLLIEYRKGALTDLFEAIMTDMDWQTYISQAVVSEYLFFHLAIFSGKAPLTVKSNHEVEHVLANGLPEVFLAQFDWLYDSVNTPSRAINLMGKYNMLPNDALILAVCLENDIKHLASFDQDYVQACAGEGIQLVQSIADWTALLVK